MSRDEYTSAFRGSPMKRAKRRGLARNAAVVLGNVGLSDDVELLSASLADEEPLGRSELSVRHKHWRRLARACSSRPTNRCVRN